MPKSFGEVRNQVSEAIAETFPKYINYLRGCSAEELGSLLDASAEMKDEWMSMQRNIAEAPLIDVLNLFYEPMLLDDRTALHHLTDMYFWMRTISEKEIHVAAKAGTLAIWYYSLAAATFGEHRLYGRLMWKELSRGYAFCERFKPEKDAVPGLEPDEEIIKNAGEIPLLNVPKQAGQGGCLGLVLMFLVVVCLILGFRWRC